MYFNLQCKVKIWCLFSSAGTETPDNMEKPNSLMIVLFGGKISFVVLAGWNGTLLEPSLLAICSIGPPKLLFSLEELNNTPLLRQEVKHLNLSLIRSQKLKFLKLYSETLDNLGNFRFFLDYRVSGAGRPKWHWIWIFMPKYTTLNKETLPFRAFLNFVFTIISWYLN